MSDYDASKMPMPDWMTIGGKIHHAAHNAIKAFKKQFDEELVRAFAFDVDRDHIGFCFDTPKHYERERDYIKTWKCADKGLLEDVGCFRYQAMIEEIYHVVGLWDTSGIYAQTLKPVCAERKNARTYAEQELLDQVIRAYNKREMTEYNKLLGDVLDILISDNAFASLTKTEDFFLGYQHHDDLNFTIHARLKDGKWIH